MALNRGVFESEGTTLSGTAFSERIWSLIVGILQIELWIDGSRSLKDKLRVVSILKYRLHREHQISVAEVDSLDNHRTAVLEITMASRCLTGLVNRLKNSRGFAIHDHQTQILTGQ